MSYIVKTKEEKKIDISNYRPVGYLQTRRGTNPEAF